MYVCYFSRLKWLINIDKICIHSLKMGYIYPREMLVLSDLRKFNLDKDGLVFIPSINFLSILNLGIIMLSYCVRK